MSLFDHKIETAKTPWQRKPREPLEAFKYFETYLYSHERNLDIISKQHNIQESHIYDLYKLWRWEERAVAYDMHQLDARTDIQVDILSSKESNLEQMTQKHLKIASLAQELGIKGLKYLHECLQSQNMSNAKRPIVTTENIVKILEFATKLERLTLGEATNISESRKKVDYSKFSDQELEQFKQLAEKSYIENE